MTEHHLEGMGGPSLEVVEIGSLIRQINPTPSALDLGAGAGRNSIFLAGIGFAVTAVEMDSSLASILNSIRTKELLQINVLQQKLEATIPARSYDLCLFLGILHFLELSFAKNLVLEHKKLSDPGAVHVVTISPEGNNESHENTLKDQGYLGSVHGSDILNWYDDWEVLAHEIYVKRDSHGDGLIDTHAIEKLVMIRPGSTHRKSIDVERTDILKSRRIVNDDYLSRFATETILLEQVRERYGREDFSFSRPAKKPQLRSVGEQLGDYELSAFFWGNKKLYFENSILVGYAEYQTNSFHSFNAR